MLCPDCKSDILRSHTLEARQIPPMSNGSRILHPACPVCGHVLTAGDVAQNISADRRVLLISGTAGAGKTALGQLIESRSGYIFVDGDAIQKRANYFARQTPGTPPNYHAQTIETMTVLCGLGYDTAVGYVIADSQTLERYTQALRGYGVAPVFRVLVPRRAVCLERDLARECWTAGPEWVDKWHEQMRAFLLSHPSMCIDNSDETLEETFDRHFAKLL